MPKLVGIMGHAGSGKDTVANMLVLHHGYEKFAIADSLRYIARHVDSQLDEIVWELGWDTAKKDPKVRRLLQNLGAAIRHEFGETFLLHHVIGKCDENSVISDVRTKAEATWLLGAGGILLKVVRPGVGPVNDDITDQDVDIPCTILHNAGTLEDLATIVDYTFGGF